MVDFERLDAAITYAVEHPEQIDMGAWFERSSCGTTACLAGTVALQAGWSPIFVDVIGDVDVTDGDVVKDGERRYVKHVAAEILGLDPSQTDDLFIHAGDVKFVIEYRNKFAAAAGVPQRTWAVAK